MGTENTTESNIQNLFKSGNGINIPINSKTFENAEKMLSVPTNNRDFNFQDNKDTKCSNDENLLFTGFSFANGNK